MKYLIAVLLLCLMPSLVFAQASRINLSGLSPSAGILPVANLPVVDVAHGGTACIGVRSISSGASDSSITNECTIIWNSATATAKAQTIPACSSTLSGRTVKIKDKYGNASTYNITVTPVSGTIDGEVSLVLNSNKSTAILECDGGTNWMRM